MNRCISSINYTSLVKMDPHYYIMFTSFNLNFYFSLFVSPLTPDWHLACWRVRRNTKDRRLWRVLGIFHPNQEVQNF